MADQFSKRLERFGDPWADASVCELLAAIADPRQPSDWGVPGLRAARALSGPNVRGTPGAGITLPLELLTRDMTAAGSASAIIGAPRINGTLSPSGLSALERLGLQVIPAPPGVLGIPFVSGAGTSGWLASEGAAVPESDITFGLRTAEPRTVGHEMTVSRSFLKSGGLAAERLVLAQMRQDAGRALDAGILNGSGSDGEPTGILSAAGTVSVSGTALSDASLLDADRQILAAGAAWDDIGYVVGPQAYETLSARERFSGAGSIIDRGTIHGRPVLVSLGLPTDALVVGPWNTLMVLLWRGVNVFADPFSLSTTGSVKYVVMADADVAIPFPGLFAKATSIT